ncbi:LysR family transcriptional regulator [Kibdelosporangium phytohabitans]|uniref:LysR family transcriptional regulator n=1 Tax=Kibdelosporangium phytohabitans TaxID=860235 RepID=A0A0N9IBK3_9PSEU|nr:LysR family transcriptional regulator [Kibdelosporangium phytohabitans]ALG12077.1 LysR family transcriptional regulator [Kibdelosporangium phytohabitans]MBE1463564.1 DNA-binding transcriptional LysR family regulator [Kibdelosporangium phytohabitans]
MSRLPVQGIECVLVLAEELHFGRTADRLGLSQSRVSQLIASLERRVGTKLVERTSRRVALTRFGAEFLAELRPAYAHLVGVVTQASERARRGSLREVRIGFQGSVYEEVTVALRRFRQHHDVSVLVTEIPLGSPFSGILDDVVDCAVVQLPARDERLTVGFRFPPQDQFLAVGATHPFSRCDQVDVEDLVVVDLVTPAGDAPSYWVDAQVPRSTPSGTALRSTTGVTTMEEGLVLVANSDHGMLVCRPFVDRSNRRDVHYIPVRGLHGTSQLGLVWRTDRTTPQLLSLARLLHEEFAAVPTLL